MSPFFKLTFKSKGILFVLFKLYFKNFFSTWWVHRLIYGTFVDEAVNAGQANETCSIKYPQCPINQDHIKLAATTFMSGFKKR